MINPALDYLSRNPDILGLEVPCSFMAHGDGDTQKVIAVHPYGLDPHKLHVKVWHLDQAEMKGVLPPSTSREIHLPDLRTPWVLFPEGTRPLGYLAEFPAVGRNRRDNPIPATVYDAICGSLFFSQSHKENREQFLWQAFERTFPKIDRLKTPHLPATHIRHHLPDYEPRLHQYWQMWKTHMLNFQGDIAPELYYWVTSVAFSSSSASASGRAWAASRPG